MKFAINISIVLIVSTGVLAQDSLRERTLREAAIDAGLSQPSTLSPETNEAIRAIGELLFNSTLLSLNGGTSCASCHLDEFGSADGLPVAIGAGGSGSGEERLESGGSIVPRNTLPLWGRGGPGFDTFFWDGKVERVANEIISQFGPEPPSSDALVVAAHLPIVQINEMLLDDEEVRSNYSLETVGAATAIFERITERIQNDPDLGPALSEAFGANHEDLSFLNIGEALAVFIRAEFQIRPSLLSEFVFEGAPLSETEIRGGLIFYGKGRCAACHNGPYFSDFGFYAVPLPQMGFGLNGFGVDYGRFNVTRETSDLYRFRTPPLWQATETAPYGHSGSVRTLDIAIRYHFDPLFEFESNTLSVRSRVEFYRRLAFWAETAPAIAALNDDEVEALVAFLRTLTFIENPPTTPGTSQEVHRQ